MYFDCWIGLILLINIPVVISDRHYELKLKQAKSNYSVPKKRLRKDVDLQATFRSFWDMSHFLLYGHVNGISVKSFIRNSTEYGCHCFIGDYFSPGGYGIPRDEFDLLCKNFSLCRKCIDIDSKRKYRPLKDKTKAPCNPQGTYKYSMRKTSVRRRIYCNDAPKTCELARCECDKQFAENLASLIRKRKKSFDKDLYTINFDGSVCKGENNNKNSKLNYSKYIPHPIDDSEILEHFSARSYTVEMTKNSQNSCCGKYPNRRPFSRDEENKICCPDGRLVPFFAQCKKY